MIDKYFSEKLKKIVCQFSKMPCSVCSVGGCKFAAIEKFVIKRIDAIEKQKYHMANIIQAQCKVLEKRGLLK